MTELAQQLIEREKQARTGYFDLGHCGLTELPGLSSLHWRHTVIVSDEWWIQGHILEPVRGFGRGLEHHSP